MRNRWRAKAQVQNVKFFGNFGKFPVKCQVLGGAADILSPSFNQASPFADEAQSLMTFLKLYSLWKIRSRQPRLPLRESRHDIDFSAGVLL
jgi:hypothetical protein